MYCPKCGAEIPEGSKFCPMCGSVIRVEPQPMKMSYSSVNFSGPNVKVNPERLKEQKKQSARQAIHTLVIINIVSFIITIGGLIFIALVLIALIGEAELSNVGEIMYLLLASMSEQFGLFGGIMLFMIGIIALAVALFGQLLAAVGLSQYKMWGWYVHFLVWIPQIMSFPIGTLVAVYSLSVFEKPEVKELFRKEKTENSLIQPIM